VTDETEQVKHLYELVDELWGLLDKNMVAELRRSNPEAYRECQAIHEIVWHDATRQPDADG